MSRKSYNVISIHSYSSVFLKVRSLWHPIDFSNNRVVSMTYAHTLQRDSHLCSVPKMRGRVFSSLISILLHKVTHICLLIWTYSYKHSCLIVCSILWIHDLFSISSNIMFYHLYSYFRILEWIVFMIFRPKAISIIVHS